MWGKLSMCSVLSRIFNLSTFCTSNIRLAMAQICHLNFRYRIEADQQFYRRNRLLIKLLLYNVYTLFCGMHLQRVLLQPFTFIKLLLHWRLSLGTWKLLPKSMLRGRAATVAMGLGAGSSFRLPAATSPLHSNSAHQHFARDKPSRAVEPLTLR